MKSIFANFLFVFILSSFMYKRIYSKSAYNRKKNCRFFEFTFSF